ncbi:MAG TPA: Gfo/Idh/MocA family oxidoreductase [Casimicrobiaceae bacterium]|nr:Gfo/Idh/MocA family oxidoreductase [Casimicrobiaceae bacterium]
MSAKVRIALIGAGTFGQRHLDYVRRDPECEAVAIADPASGAAAYARERGIAYFGDCAEMLAEARPDGVIVASPNSLHAPIGLLCVAAGVPVLMEKPVADTIAAATALVEAAEQRGVPILVGHHRRHNPLVERARDLVQGGALGTLTCVNAMWLMRKPDAYFSAAWRRQSGGGPLLINLIHDVDALRYICGEIVSVDAFGSNAVRGHPVEDTAAILLRFESGALGTIALSDAVAAPWGWDTNSGESDAFAYADENSYYFAGTAGSLAFPRMELWRYAGSGDWSTPLRCERIEVPKADPLARQLRHFVRVIRGEEAPRVSARDAMRSLALTLAIEEAARKSAAISGAAGALPLPAPDPGADGAPVAAVSQ